MLAGGICRGQDSSNQTPTATFSESLPRIIYTQNEDGELVPFVDKFPWDAYKELIAPGGSNEQPGCIATSFLLDVQADEGHASAQNSITLKILQDGQHRVAIGMSDCHFLTHPQIVNGPEDVSVFARFDPNDQNHEIVVTGKAKQEIEVKFTTEFALSKVGSRTFFRMNLPRFPASRLQVQIQKRDVTAGVSDGMTVKQLTPDADTPEENTDTQGSRQVSGRRFVASIRVLVATQARDR